MGLVLTENSEYLPWVWVWLTSECSVNPSIVLYTFIIDFVVCTHNKYTNNRAAWLCRYVTGSVTRKIIAVKIDNQK